jgi:hypothetical protein
MSKNVNPKSLKGKDKMNRIKDLMGRMQTLNESTSLSELELIKKGPNGVIYGVIRENHKYFIKTTEKTSGTLNAEDFSYIGGLQNKFSEAYDSYAAATKQLNLKFDMLNESLGIDENNNILESDGVRAGFGFVVEEEVVEDEVVEDTVEDGDEDLDEQKKVLKVDTPTPEPAPAPAEPMAAEPSMEEPIEDEVPDDMGMEDPMADAGMEDPSMDDEGDDESDPTKKIQKMTGKITQMMREMEEPDVDLEKYVINSVISALHMDLFSEEDVEDIVAKLEGEDEEDDTAADELGGEEEGAIEEPAMEEPVTDEEPAMEEPVMAEESFKVKKGALVESLTKKILKDTLNESDDYGSMKPSSPRRRKAVAAKRRRWANEHHDMDMDDTSDYGKYDGDEYINEFEGIESDYIDCDECNGMGCPHCDDMGYHLSNDVADDFMTLNADGEYGPFDRDGDEIPADIDLDDDNDGILDEMDGDGFGVDVMDSISGSFDRDGDDIPAKIDNSMYGDGEDDLGDLDIQFFSEPLTKPRPTTKPGTPTTTPGEKERKGPWTKPKTRPKPKAADDTKPKRSFRRRGFYK